MKTLSDKIQEHFLVTLLLGGVTYAAIASWQNSQELTRISNQLTAQNESIIGLKRSLVSMLLDEKPDKSSIAKDLVTDAALMNGLKEFRTGKFDVAFAHWEYSAKSGNHDSAFAISVATDSLRQKLTNPNLPAAERASIEAALRNAPEVKEMNGIYFLQGER